MQLTASTGFLFQRARLKLTLWYVIVILCVTSLISTLFYIRVTATIEQQLYNLERRVVEERIRQFFSSFIRHYEETKEEVRAAKEHIALQLVMINASIVVIVALAGYWLAGKTLAPIEEAMDRQRRFVGDAAHELRTPLAAMKTTLQVQEMEELPNGVRATIKKQLAEIDQLSSLTESLLRLTTVTQTHQAKLHTFVAIAPIIEAVVQQLEPLSAEKKLQVSSKLDNSLQVIGDPVLLRELFFILIENAIKYTPDSGEILIAGTQEKRGKVKVTIQDTGIGISRSDLPHIFERFYRADTVRSRAASKTANNQKKQGYGLGLALAKEIVFAHQGKIFVSSKLGVGTQFSVFLPS